MNFKRGKVTFEMLKNSFPAHDFTAKLAYLTHVSGNW